MSKPKRFLTRFWREDGGAAAAEYALLLAIIAAGLAIAAGTLGSEISEAMHEHAECIDLGPDCTDETTSQ